MCDRCDYRTLMTDRGLGTTANRIGVLRIVGNSAAPVSAHDIFERLNRSGSVNRVTVYRILDLLVESGLVERLSGGGRTFFYGLAPNENHDPHPHFYCRRCGNMQCLKAGSLELDTGSLSGLISGRIENVEVRLDGVCKTCLNATGAIHCRDLGAAPGEPTQASGSGGGDSEGGCAAGAGLAGDGPLKIR